MANFKTTVQRNTAPQPPVLEIFSDYVWPWCYFITGRIEKLKKNHGISVRWRAFPLHPDTPEQGLSLEALFAKKGLPMDVDKVMASLKEAARRYGVEIGDRKKTYNSRLAQEAGLWAEEKGCGHDFHMNAFKAYFTDGKNLSDITVLLNLIEQSGLDRSSGESVIRDRTYSDAVDADWALARQLEIKAVPTFICGGARLVGAQSYSALEKLISR